MPITAPWRTLLQHRLANLKPRRGGNWPPHLNFILFATRMKGGGSDLWWGIWKAWTNIRHALTFQPPTTPDTVAQQPLFWNGEIVNEQGEMLGDQPHAFGCLWARRGIGTITDIWDNATQTWRSKEDLRIQIGRTIPEERYAEVINTIPNTWNMRGNPALHQHEWAATLQEGRIERIYQLLSPFEGRAFHEVKANFFVPSDEPPHSLEGIELSRVRVTTASGDLKNSTINPKEVHKDPVCNMGLVKTLPFDPAE